MNCATTTSFEEHFPNQCAQSINGGHDDNKNIHKPAFDKVQKLCRAQVQEMNL